MLFVKLQNASWCSDIRVAAHAAAHQPSGLFALQMVLRAGTLIAFWAVL